MRLLLWGIGFAICAGIAWVARERILSTLNVALALFPGVPARVAGATRASSRWAVRSARESPRHVVRAARASARRPAVRRAVANVAAVGTLAAGMAASVLDLDGGWWQRRRRFWSRTPGQIDAALLAWADRAPDFADKWAGADDLHAWAARQDRSGPYGRAVVRVTEHYRRKPRPGRVRGGRA